MRLFARAYADQIEADHQAFVRVVASGRLTASRRHVAADISHDENANSINASVGIAAELTFASPDGVHRPH